MSRNEIQWLQRPQFPETHYVNSDIYHDPQIFKEEQEKIFNKCWIIACHESEIPIAFDYRTFQHPGGVPLNVVRGEDTQVRCFYNICPHRGNTLLYEPVGNAKRITCIFHAWAFDSKGSCIDISRGKQGYPNGHASVGSMAIKYDAYEGSQARGVGWPGLAPGGWGLIDVVPGMTFNLRTSVLRMDTAIQLGPDKLVIEFRGLGLKSDTPEQRAERVRDHNTIWGPFGRQPLGRRRGAAFRRQEEARRPRVGLAVQRRSSTLPR